MGPCGFLHRHSASTTLDHGLQPGIETGARYYPWALTDKGIRPYLGLSWQVMHYSFGSGGDMVKNLAMPSFGTTFWYRNFMFDVGAAYSFINEVDYDVYRPKAVSNFGISLGVKYSLETTLSAEKDWESGRTKKVTEILADRKALNGWTVAIGPSVAFHFSPNSHLKRLAPSLFPDRPTEVFLEYGLGYYWHRPDLQLNLSYRNTRASDAGYGNSMHIRKMAITLEGLVFLGDYHGFAPFVGPNVSYDIMQLEVQHRLRPEVQERKEGVFGGLTFGWDIRPNRIQSWYLRTNLRWMPWRDIYIANKSPVDFDQFEFNFIQLVLFPDRIF